MSDGDTFLVRLADMVQAGRDRTARPYGRVVAEVADAVGCMLRGAGHPMVSRLVASGERWESGGPFVSWATGVSSTLEHAVTIDSVACHVDEFDSIHAASATAPASVVVAPTLIVGSWLGSSGVQVLDAVSCGYDVVTAAARRWGGPALYRRGWWPTSAFGALGATAAVGVLLDLDENALTHALGIAATSAGGLLSADRLSEGHYLSGARAAQEGTRAALRAAEGMQASWTLLDEPAIRAFGPIVSDDPLADPARGPSSSAGSVEHCVIKWYPCARPLHGVVEGLRRLRANGLTFDEADTVRVAVHPDLLPFLNSDEVVEGPTEAAASVVFAVAAVLGGHESDPDFYRGARLPPETPLPRVELCAREVPEFSWEAEVTAHTGATGERTTILAAPSMAMRTEALRAKFMSNATVALGAEQAESMWNALTALERSDDVAAVIRRSVPRDCT